MTSSIKTAMKNPPPLVRCLLKQFQAARLSHQPSSSFLPTFQRRAFQYQQIRFAHGRTRHPAKKVPLPPVTESSSSSISRTYEIWAIAAVFVAIGVGKQLGDSREKKIFDPPRFTPFEIVDRVEASPTSIILTLRPRHMSAKSDAETADPYKEQWEKGTWSVEMKQPELQIARRYTPLPPCAGASKTDLRFFIRKEHRGEMSGYLHTLQVGAEIGLRGPHSEYSLPNGDSNVVFLAAGTGIAPAFQVAHTLLERRDAGKAKMHIVWANRRREDCEGGFDFRLAKALTGTKRGKIVTELDELQRKHPDQISVDYLVDEEGKFLDQKKISQLVTPGPATTEDNTKLILISGPDGFVNSFAGPKKWEGGKEGQGALGGVLGQMRPKDWIIWKL